MDAVAKKPFYKKWWVWVIAVIVVIGIGSQGSKMKSGSSRSDVEINTRGGLYMASNVNAAFKFKSNGEVTWVGSFNGIDMANTGKYRINEETKEVVLSDWNKVPSPKGNLMYEVTGNTITAVTNQKGVRYEWFKK